MLFPPQPEFTTLIHANFPNPIDIVSSHKHLGIVIDAALSWVPHIEYICKKSSSSSSSRIYYFDREGPTDVAVLLQGTLSALK